jgi:symplekin
MALVPTDHPILNSASLENEGIAILRDIVTLIISTKCVAFTSSYNATDNLIRNPDLLTAAINGCGALIASRPSTHQVMCLALISWNPAPLVTAGVPPLAIKSVEKCVRLVLVHMQRLLDFLNRRSLASHF